MNSPLHFCLGKVATITRLRLPLLTGCLSVLLSITAHAEGSRSIHPTGYPAAGKRSNLDDQGGAGKYADVVNRLTFLYVYARQGEQIVLGSSNRANGGDVLVYDPQSFGTPGDETEPGTVNFRCSVGGIGSFGGGALGTIANRAQELAGPGAANGTVSGNQFVPCAYQAPRDGIYGVHFTKSTGGGGPDASVDPLQTASNNSTAAWDVSVRADAASTTDINGRLFTYAWNGFTGGNGNPIYHTFYYVTSDGYRYRQEFRGTDPNGYTLYANSKGFIDAGSPLYKDVRGSNAYAARGANPASGIVSQPAQYPIFFSDVTPGGANDAAVRMVLAQLGIPAVPAAPTLQSVSFTGNVAGSTSSQGAGGMFGFTTTNTLSYQIVISADGVDFDPAKTTNRILTGTALGGTHSRYWDGRDNAGAVFPASAAPYPYRVLGRNGEAHFPLVDAEFNTTSGPTMTRLNGSAADRTTVFYDDRGYVTSNGTAIGDLNGKICGAAYPQASPVPDHSLVGQDSLATYRTWTGTGNANADCSATGSFGDAKALDLWVYQFTSAEANTLTIVAQTAGVDVGTAASVANQVYAGQTVNGSFVFRNDGDAAANGVTYAASLGAPGGYCPAAVNFSAVPPGVTVGYNAATCALAFTGMPTTLAASSGLPFNFSYVAPATAGTVTLTTAIQATNENNDRSSNSASAQTQVILADVATAITGIPTTVAAGSAVSATVSFSNLGGGTATGVTYRLTVGTAGSCPANASVSNLPAGASAVYDPNSCVVALSGMPASLAPSASVSIGVAYTAPPSGGTVPISSGVTTQSPESSTLNNSATVTTTASAAAVDMQAAIAGFAPVAVGGAGTGTVTCTNAGPSPAAAAQCTVGGLPPGATVSCVPAAPAVLAVNASIVCTVGYTMPAAPFTVTGTAGATENDPVAANNVVSFNVAAAVPGGAGGQIASVPVAPWWLLVGPLGFAGMWRLRRVRKGEARKRA